MDKNKIHQLDENEIYQLNENWIQQVEESKFVENQIHHVDGINDSLIWWRKE